MTYNLSEQDTFTYDNTEWQVMTVWQPNEDGTILVTATPAATFPNLSPRAFCVGPNGARPFIDD
jgi:hypothetical protein